MLHTGPQSEHGGHTNAYTAAEDTNYHFDCNTDALDEAVDRFAQVAPVQPIDVQAMSVLHGQAQLCTSCKLICRQALWQWTLTSACSKRRGCRSLLS